MDAENGSSQLVNISGREVQDQEAGNVGSLFYKKDKQCPNGCMDFVPPTLLQKITAETISTFILVFVTCGSSILDHGSPPLVSQLGGSVASGLIVTVMIYSVGHISGAHMNPAVTIAFATVRHFPWKQVPAYITAQLGGSLAACFALRVMLKPVSNTGITIPSGTVLQALAMEVVVSFVLMFVTSAVATDSSAIGELAGIAVGSMVMISSVFAGPISGGSMNPARSLGPAIVSNNYKAIWVYLVGPITGTLMGACSYSIIRLTDKPLQSISLRRASSFSSSGRSLKYGDSKSAVPNDLI
jgi:aquaporin NIP